MATHAHTKPGGTKYPGIESRIMDSIRRRGDGIVTTQDMIAATKNNKAAVSSVMAGLSRKVGSGLSRLRAGAYRYHTSLDQGYLRWAALNGQPVPAKPAEQVVELPAEPETPAPAPEPVSPHTVTISAPRRRSDTGILVLRYAQEKHGQLIDAETVARDLKLRMPSVRTVMNRWADNESVPQFERVTTGPRSAYRYTLSAEEREARGLKPLAEVTLAEVFKAEVDAADAEERPTPKLDETVQKPAVEFVEEPAPTPAPAPEPAKDESVFLGERVAQVGDGRWLVKLDDGSYRWLLDLQLPS